MTGAGHFTYFITVFLMVAGLFIVIARNNLIKKLIGLGIFQTSVYLLYIAPGKLVGGTAPILSDALAWLDCTVYSRFSAGSHTIYIGEVQASGVPRPDVKPLLYWNRGYRQLAK